tara:strand:- start:10 stop:747 length:738 start_codon:yes stop_codon:yes gene_type:complete
MAIKNLSLQTIGLHVGLKDYSKTTSQQVPYKKTGVLTCSGISIFGDCSSISGKAAVTIGTVDSGSKLPFSDSLYVLGTSKFFADMTVAASIKVTKDVTIGGTMKAGYATWSGSIVATTKLFDIKHPSKEGHRLAHASLEGPEVGVYCRGRLKESNVINLPEYWKDLVHEDSITVQLQPIGSNQNLVIQEFNNEFIVIAEDSTNTDLITDLSTIDCFYHVYGERKDVERLTVEYESDTILEQGKPK